MKRLLLLLLLLALPAQAQSLRQTAEEIQAATAPVLESYGNRSDLSWGQQQALEDLLRMRSAALEITGALDAGSTPDDLRPRIERLSIARNRVKMTLPLLGLSAEQQAPVDQAVARAAALDGAVRELADRFDGRDQPMGENLAEAPLNATERPYYANPNELLREARGMRWSAERLYASYGYPNRFWSGYPGPISPFTAQDLYELTRAAYEYEYACSARYAQVEDTYPAFARLARAYSRVSYLPLGGVASFEAYSLERAIGRLERFYTARD